MRVLVSVHAVATGRGTSNEKITLCLENTKQWRKRFCMPFFLWQGQRSQALNSCDLCHPQSFPVEILCRMDLSLLTAAVCFEPTLQENHNFSGYKFKINSSCAYWRTKSKQERYGSWLCGLQERPSKCKAGWWVSQSAAALHALHVASTRGGAQVF